MLVYIELALVLAHTYLFAKPAPAITSHRRKRPEGHYYGPSQVRKRRHRNSVGLYLSDQGVAGGGGGAAAAETRPAEMMVVVGAGGGGGGPVDGAGLVRDFESVGGWKFTGSAEEEAQWRAMNSRLELPAVPDRKRKHRRSLTSGSSSLSATGGGTLRREQRYSSEVSMGFQVGMGSRTPPARMAASSSSIIPPDSYFPSHTFPEMERPGEATAAGGPSSAPRSPTALSNSSGTSSRGSQLLMKSSGAN